MWNSLIVGVFVAFLTGCGRGVPQAEMSGTVTFDGKPVGPGWIEFASREMKTAASGGRSWMRQPTLLSVTLTTPWRDARRRWADHR